MKKVIASVDIQSDHSWSGWPGAICLRCGISDPMEQALADGWFDPTTDTWDTPEHETQVRELHRKCVVVRGN